MKRLTFSKDISVGTWILFGAALLCIPLKIATLLSTAFADFFNRYISSIFRAIFAHITSIFPFSVAELLLLVLLPIAVLFLAYTFTVSVHRGKLRKQTLRVLSVLAFLLASFFLNFGAAYDCTPVADKMELEITTPDTDNLYLASAYTLIHLGDLEDEIAYKPSGQSDLPYSFSEMVDKLNAAYDKLYEQYDFLSPLHTGVKRIALSKPMTYTHLSGVYTPFTGEANVNINYPDYIIAFTTAHEMAHQRGIGPEDEANFIAYLACMHSDDPYLQYAGHANMLEYLSAALRKADPESWQNRLYRFYPEGLLREYAAYSAMFAPYTDNIASDVSDAVNDTYLKANGEAAGTESYDLVTELAVAYILQLEEVPN